MMKFGLSSGILLLTAAAVYANPVLLSFDAELDPVCPSGYSQPANSGWANCYKVFSDFKFRRDAASQCRMNNGTLASVSNAFVNSYLNFLATQIDAGSFWLGVECFNGDVKTCMHDDGTPFTYSNFRPGEPRSDGECIYTTASGRDSQQWLSFDCNQKFQFACEAKVGEPFVPTTTTRKTTLRPTTTTTIEPADTTTIENTVTGTVTAATWGYSNCPDNYIAFQSMCYLAVYVGTNQITANGASTICKQVPGGMLASVHNAQVNSFLASIQFNSYYSAFGLRCKAQFAGDRSTCKWDDGTPFNYQNFLAQNYPYSVSGGECCNFEYGQYHFIHCYDCDTYIYDGYICQASMH